MKYNYGENYSSSNLYKISGESRIRFSVYFHGRVLDEDHCPGFHPTPECIPEECLEHSRLYYCDDRVGCRALPTFYSDLILSHI